MFETLGYPKSLEESRFDEWLENARKSRLGYRYLIVLWNNWDNDFQPLYAEERSQLSAYQIGLASEEELVAVYDVYSESRISF